MAEAGQARHTPGRNRKPGRGRPCLHPLPPRRPQPSRNPQGLHLAGRALRRRSATVQGRDENKQPLLTRSWPRASAVAARVFHPPLMPTLKSGSAGLSSRRRLSHTPGLRLRKSRPGAGAPARQLTAPAQPPLGGGQLPGAARLATESSRAGKVQREYLRLGARPVPPQHCRSLRHDHSARVWAAEVDTRM